MIYTFKIKISFGLETFCDAENHYMNILYIYNYMKHLENYFILNNLYLGKFHIQMIQTNFDT